METSPFKPLSRHKIALHLLGLRILTLITLGSIILSIITFSERLFALADESRTVIAIGDIHGEIDSLNEILLKSGAVNAVGELNPDIHLVFIGDLIGNGPNSPAVIERVMELVNQATATSSEVTIVAGNHEINLLKNNFSTISKADQKKWADWINPDEYWKESISLALTNPYYHTENAETLRQFYKALVPFAKINQRLFVHAGISHDMFTSSLNKMTSNFKKRILSLMDTTVDFRTLGHGEDDWMFDQRGPILTSETADPKLAPMILDKPMSQLDFESFLSSHNLTQVVVGHWMSSDGIVEHSVYGDKIIHIDTAIGRANIGMLSYLKIKPDGKLAPRQWQSAKLINKCETIVF